MSRIMCSQTLWSSLGFSGHPPADAPVPQLHGVALGGWAAKVFRDSGRQLVLALDERTQLALVFPLAPRKRFREHFAGALRAMLEDLSIDPATITAETDAIQFEPLCQLTDAALVQRLSDLQYICGLELLYHEDLRLVQCNLNDLPHGTPPYLSKVAVVNLFRDRPGTPASRLH